MLNIGDLIVDSLDYIFIVDKNFKIIYNTRYDEELVGNQNGNEIINTIGKNFFDVYPKIKIEDSSIVQCLQSRKIIVKKRQYYEDYAGRKYLTNNVTFPLLKKGELIAAVEIAIDIEENIESVTNSDRVFDDFVFKLKKNTGIISFDSILTVSKSMLDCVEKARFLSLLPNPVLIYGETGTGKELIAQAMITHRNVPKTKVIIQNCAAVPENLMESILFGTRRGAYTGAENNKGLFELANGGILFLDELNSVPYNLQSKLLRVLQEGTFMPIGETEEVHVSVKVIAAMNVDPIKALDEKIIRKDLFYRFSSGLITVPSLRDRKEDIALFINYYINYFSQMYDKNVIKISSYVRNLFMNYSWEGNVRELKNAIESMVISSGNDQTLTVDHIPSYLLTRLEEEFKIDNSNKVSVLISDLEDDFNSNFNN